MADGLLESLADIQTLQDLADRYELGSLLGEGRFSKVWRATPTSADTAVSSTPVALKEIALDVLEDDEEAFEMLEAEVDALRHAAKVDTLGERVVKLHEVVKTDECARTLPTRAERSRARRAAAVAPVGGVARGCATTATGRGLRTTPLAQQSCGAPSPGCRRGV